MAFEQETIWQKQVAPAFELRVVPAPRRSDQNVRPGYRLALWQRTTQANGTPSAAVRHLVTVGGTALQVVLDQVLDTLRREGYRSTMLAASQREALPLGEENGVRLGLLFLAVKPLTKVTRMEAIANGIRAMPGEEAYYWFSKCVRPQGRNQAMRALRVLLAPE